MTDEGKRRSRRNAVRHGLTAETVIGDLENEEDYKAFELSVTSGFDAPTAVERELVLRLASLLWRLRRATAIETGLLQLQSDIIGALKCSRETEDPPDRSGKNQAFTQGNRTVDCGADRNDPLRLFALSYLQRSNPNGTDEGVDAYNSEIACCFLRLANLDNGAFERVNRYETVLWRQAGQILLTLDFFRRNRPLP